MVPEFVPISEVLQGRVADAFQDLGFDTGSVATIVGKLVMVVLISSIPTLNPVG